MQTIAKIHSVLRTWTRKSGPYIVLEMLLPGGTLFALLLFLYRRSQLLQAAAQTAESQVRVAAKARSSHYDAVQRPWLRLPCECAHRAF